MLKESDKKEWLKKLSQEGQDLEGRLVRLEAQEGKLRECIMVLKGVAHLIKREDLKREANRELAEYQRELSDMHNEEEQKEINLRLRYIRLLEKYIREEG